MMFRVLAEEEPDLRVLNYSPGEELSVCACYTQVQPVNWGELNEFLPEVGTQAGGNTLLHF